MSLSLRLCEFEGQEDSVVLYHFGDLGSTVAASF